LLIAVAKTNSHNFHTQKRNSRSQWNKKKGTELDVFSGREARLNRVIFVVLDAKNPLTSYDMYLAVRRIKGFRHVKWRSIDRRIKALYVQGWIIKRGTRLAKAHFLSPLYALDVRAQVALALDRIDLNIFIQVAPESGLELMVDLLSIHLKEEERAFL
jgi:hypothetical protein